MAKALVIVVMAVAGMAALVILVSLFGMMRHRKRPFWWLAVNGIAWFDPANFGPGANPYRRRLLVGAGVFAAAVGVGIVVSIVTRH